MYNLATGISFSRFYIRATDFWLHVSTIFRRKSCPRTLTDHVHIRKRYGRQVRHAICYNSRGVIDFAACTSHSSVYVRSFAPCCVSLVGGWQVIALEGRSERLAKGDEVLAVYVDTTSFYHATIVIPPRGRGANIVSAGQSPRRFLRLSQSFVLVDVPWARSTPVHQSDVVPRHARGVASAV